MVEAAKLIFIRHDSALKRTRRSLNHLDSLTAKKGAAATAATNCACNEVWAKNGRIALLRELIAGRWNERKNERRNEWDEESFSCP